MVILLLLVFPIFCENLKYISTFLPVSIMLLDNNSYFRKIFKKIWNSNYVFTLEKFRISKVNIVVTCGNRTGANVTNILWAALLSLNPNLKCKYHISACVTIVQKMLMKFNFSLASSQQKSNNNEKKTCGLASNSIAIAVQLVS